VEEFASKFPMPGSARYHQKRKVKAKEPAEEEEEEVVEDLVDL